MILMDCQMPGIDGYETTRRIRSESTGLEHLPIIAATAHALAGEREKSIAAGMDDHLTKPITLAALAGVISRWGSRRISSLAPQATSEPPSTPQATAEPPLVPEIAASCLDPEVTRSPNVVRVFLNHVPSQIERIERAIQSADAEELAQAAHRLKGSCAMFGAVKMAELCRKLERALDDRDTLYRDLVAEHSKVVAEVQTQPTD